MGCFLSNFDVTKKFSHNMIKYSLEKIFLQTNMLVRSNLPGVFFEVGFLKSFTIFAWNQLCWNVFLINLQPFRSKKETPTRVFYRTPPVAASSRLAHSTSTFHSKICLLLFRYLLNCMFVFILVDPCAKVFCVLKTCLC